MTGRESRVGALLLVMLALGVGACSGGQAGSPIPSSIASTTALPSTAPAPATATSPPAASSSPSQLDGPPPTSQPSSTPSQSASPQVPAVPPPATIGDVAGSLGSYTWDGVMADGPWIVPKSGSLTTPGTTLTVAFGGGADATPVSWDASWAPVRNGTAGTPRGAGSGQGTVSIVTPGSAGTWSLRVTAQFGEGREATWFWRVTVAP